MCTSPIKCIPSDDSFLGWQPEQRVVNSITLNRTKQNNWTCWVALQNHKTIWVRIRFPRRSRHIIFPENSRPELDLVVILPIDAGTYIWRSIKRSCRECLKDRVGAEVMIGVMVGYEDGLKGIGGCIFDPGDNGKSVGDEEGGVDEDGGFCAYD